MKNHLITVIVIITHLLLSPVSAQDKVIIGIGDVTSSIPGSDPQTFQIMLETQLIKTNKFTVIERARLVEILQEQGLTQMGLTTDGNELGGITGVDYLVYGSITKLGSAKSGSNFGGFGLGGNTTEMAVDIRLVDTDTGEVVLADTVENSVKAGSSIQIAGLASSSSKGDPLSDVQRLTSRGIVGAIATTIYPAKVIVIQKDGTHILNYGNGLFQMDDYVKVFEVGEGFEDPDTGEILGAEEIEVGMLKVTEAAAKFSKAILVSGNAIARGNIVKKLSKEEINSAKKLEKKSRKSKRKRL